MKRKPAKPKPRRKVKPRLKQIVYGNDGCEGLAKRKRRKAR